METRTLKTSFTQDELERRPHPLKVDEVFKLAESFVTTCQHYNGMCRYTDEAEDIRELGFTVVETVYTALIEATEEFSKIIVEGLKQREKDSRSGIDLQRIRESIADEE